MQSTIDNPTKKTTQNPVIGTMDKPAPTSQQIKTKDILPLVNAVAIMVGLFLVISLSVANGKLFLKELVVSATIITLLLAMRLMDSNER